MLLQLVLFALAASKIDGTASDLAQKIKSGDHQAFQQFYNAHYDGLSRFLLSKNTSPEATKDLIQKAFIYIWEHRQKIDPGKSLRAYIFQIAYTRMLNYHRDTKKFDTEAPVTENEDNLTPEDTARAAELEEAIDQAIEAMPAKRGTVFRLCFVEDFTYREAAQTLEVSKKTVENHMGYALKDIRKALTEFR